MKYVLVDKRIRNLEKEKLEELGYTVILIPKNNNVYEEISSHVDIFCSKIGNSLVVEPTIYKFIKGELYRTSINVIKGDATCGKIYPYDVPYNVCIHGKNIVHNFKYTDREIINLIEKYSLKKINVSQGYSNCSIFVVDDNSVITTDRGICKMLRKNGIDVLFINETLDIKLLNKDSYSSMQGFIGGAISRLGNNVFVSGDLSNIDKEGKIRKYIINRGLQIVDFKGLDVIDYGKIIEIGE